jgi:hypothetical protein
LKCREFICFSELNIEKYGEKHSFEKQVLIAGEGLVISLEVEYLQEQKEELRSEEIQYHILGESIRSDIAVKYGSKEMSALREGVSKGDFPKRTKGFLLKLSIPQELAGQTKSVELLL